MKVKLKYIDVYLLLGVVIIVSLSSCSNGKDSLEDYSEPVLTHTLKKVREYEIEIDSVTAPNFKHFQYYQQCEQEYFTILNPIDQQLNFYDLNTKKLARKIPLPYQGPHGVGNLQGLTSGYHIHNQDSIFILNRNHGRLYLLNGQSEKLHTHAFVRSKTLPSAGIGVSCPMYINKNQAYLLNVQTGIDHLKKNKNYRSDYATKIDLETYNHHYFLSYPETYTKGSWGYQLHKKFWAINPYQEKIVVSYPLDQFLYEYDLEGQLVDRYPAVCSLRSPPRSMTRNERGSDQGQSSYFLAQDRYDQLYFDPVRRIYIRDFLVGITPEELKRINRNSKIRYLVLLDEKFNKIGEVVERSFGPLLLFFNEEGIHKVVPSKDEDVMKFEVYEYSEI